MPNNAWNALMSLMSAASGRPPLEELKAAIAVNPYNGSWLSTWA